MLLLISAPVILTDEIRLHQTLLGNYSSVQLPVMEGKDRQVGVQIGLTLQQVVDVVSYCSIYFHEFIFTEKPSNAIATYMFIEVDV